MAGAGIAGGEILQGQRQRILLALVQVDDGLIGRIVPAGSQALQRLGVDIETRMTGAKPGPIPELRIDR
jgi:hypothetical protein